MENQIAKKDHEKQKSRRTKITKSKNHEKTKTNVIAFIFKYFSMFSCFANFCEVAIVCWTEGPKTFKYLSI